MKNKKTKRGGDGSRDANFEGCNEHDFKYFSKTGMSKNEGDCPKRTASSTTSLLPNNTPISFTKRVLVFAVAVFNIFAQHLYFTIPMSFLANEMLEVCIANTSLKKSFFF